MDSLETTIKGYDYGQTTKPSPITLKELELLKATVLFTQADEENPETHPHTRPDHAVTSADTPAEDNAALVIGVG